MAYPHGTQGAHHNIGLHAYESLWLQLVSSDIGMPAVKLNGRYAYGHMLSGAISIERKRGEHAARKLACIP